MERTLVLVKPDGVQRGLVGEVISRLERRGLKLAAMKLMNVSDSLARQHYAEHVDRPFFADLVVFISSSPVDLALDIGRNLVHGSDSPESAARELALFFSPGEVLEYQRNTDLWINES